MCLKETCLSAKGNLHDPVPSNAIRKFRSSGLLHVNTGKDDFKIQNLSDIQYNLNGKKHIVVRDHDNHAASIEGDEDSLPLLKEILGSCVGQRFRASLDDILFPLDVKDYYKVREDIIHRHRQRVAHTNL